MGIFGPIDKKMATEDTRICLNFSQGGKFRPRRSYHKDLGPPVKREDNGLLLLCTGICRRARGGGKSLWNPLL